MRIFVSLIVFLGVIVSGGCQGSVMDVEEPSDIGANPVEPLSTPLPDSPTQEFVTPDRINATMTKLPERVPPTEATTPVAGEVPTDLLDSMLKDLAGRIGVALENISVIQAQATIWNDGSLGCAKPGEFYTRALVKGYWVVLEVGDQKYDYGARKPVTFSFVKEDSLQIRRAPQAPDGYSIFDSTIFQTD